MLVNVNVKWTEYCILVHLQLFSNLINAQITFTVALATLLPTQTEILENHLIFQTCWYHVCSNTFSYFTFFTIANGEGIANIAFNLLVPH